MPAAPPVLWTDCLVLAEELSFRRAADRLGIDQSVLSRRIRQVEEEVGFRLFARTTRRVSLTEAGAILMEQVRRSAAEFDRTLDAARAADAGRTGRLRIAYMSFAAPAAMPALVAAYAERRPEVRLDLLYMHTAAQKVALARGDIDVGFMIGPVDERSFAGFTLARERLVALVPARHPAAKAGAVPLPELVRSGLVLGSAEEWDYFRALLRAQVLQRGYDLPVAYEASDFIGILGLVEAGLGPTITVEGVVPMLPPGVAAVRIEEELDPIPLVLCWRPDALGAPARAFVDLARRRPARRPAA